MIGFMCGLFLGGGITYFVMEFITISRLDKKLKDKHNGDYR